MMPEKIPIKSSFSIFSITLAVLFAVGYFIVWLWLSSPYRAFPSDDRYIANNLAAYGDSSLELSNILKETNPVYYLSAYSVLKICGTFASKPEGCDSGEVILGIAIASNAATVFLLGILIFRLTNSLFAQLAAHALFATAAWPVTYHFMVSYTVTTAALVIFAIFLITTCNKAAPWRPVLAGITTSLVFWSSSSGPLTACILIVSVVFLSWEGRKWTEWLKPSRYDRRRLAIFFLGFFACTLFFGYFGWERYIDHLMDNLRGDHYVNADKALGFVARPPFPSYLHVLNLYSPVSLLMLVVALGAILFLLWTGKIKEKAEKRIAAITVILGLFVLLHMLVIDLLPSTKLARAHFPAYPVSIVIIVIAIFLAHRQLTASVKGKIFLPTLLFSVALSAMFFEGLRTGVETYRVRTTAAEQLNELRSMSRLFVLQNDPHRFEMSLALDWEFYEYPLIEPPRFTESGRRRFYMIPKASPPHLIRAIRGKEFMELVTKSNERNIVLLLGPHGSGSGLPLHKKDFYPADFVDLGNLRSLIKETKVLPYYRHYPPFLMEEEVSQALYFLGRIPDYRNPSMGITVLRF
ncbi:MAG: hypothetical protein ACYC1T_13360 [Sulfuricaulis sp.]